MKIIDFFPSIGLPSLNLNKLQAGDRQMKNQKEAGAPRYNDPAVLDLKGHRKETAAS
jgi:hypothetical protein